MIKRSMLAMLVVVASLGIANAQAGKGANGGKVAKSQGHPIEFVQKDQQIIFYLGDDDGSPLPTESIRGRATALRDPQAVRRVTNRSVRSAC